MFIKLWCQYESGKTDPQIKEGPTVFQLMLERTF